VGSFEGCRVAAIDTTRHDPGPIATRLLGGVARRPAPMNEPIPEDRAGALLVAGDLAAAAEAVVRDHGPALLGYLSSILRNDSDAAEVFSQFTEDLWRGLPGFRHECPLRVWAYKLAWHAAARHLRDPYRARGRPLETTELSRIADEVRSSVLLGRREARQRGIDRLRAQLAPDEQTLLVLRLDRGLSWREVATVLSDDGEVVDEPALRKRFERLKDRLATMARAEGLLE
jgi:RNA polymerase sigma-70 factor (ECF subfamily)